jgi:hypothetical protein
VILKTLVPLRNCPASHTDFVGCFHSDFVKISCPCCPTSPRCHTLLVPPPPFSAPQISWSRFRSFFGRNTHAHRVKIVSKHVLFVLLQLRSHFFKFLKNREKTFQNWQEITPPRTPGTPQNRVWAPSVGGFWSSPYRKTKEWPQIWYYLRSARFLNPPKSTFLALWSHVMHMNASKQDFDQTTPKSVFWTRFGAAEPHQKY